MARGVQGAHVVVGVPLPPPDPRPYVPLITLPGRRETAFLALHEGVTGFLMHWVNNQHVPHPKDREYCCGCKMGQTPRWEGFVGVVSLNTMNRFIMRIPAGAFRHSGPFRAKSDAGHLAGVVFTAYRFGSTSSKTNPAVIELVDQVCPVPKVHPFPLFAALSRYWRRENLEGIDYGLSPEKAGVVNAEDFISFARRTNAARKRGAGRKP